MIDDFRESNPMNKRVAFLHITDSHLSGSGTPFPRDDLKVEMPGIATWTREASMELLLSRLAERLKQDRQTLESRFRDANLHAVR